MIWKLFLGVVLSLVSIAASQYTMAAGIVDTIVQPYQSAGAQLAQKTLTYATSTFWLLAAIQFSASSIRLALSGSDLQEWVSHIVRQIFFVGIYAWIMQNFYHFSELIIASFKQVATADTVSPANVFQVGLKIAATIYANASITHPISATVYGVGSLAIALCFGWIAALIIVALCEGYILIAAGVLLTGLGGSEWTRDFSNKALLLSMSVGAKIFIMYTLIDVGWSVMNTWTQIDYTLDTSVFEVVAAVFIYVLVVMQLPSLAQQFISGAATGSTAADGIKNITQAAATAALAATGVGIAGAAAYKAAAAGLEGAGAGDAGAGGAGAGGAGAGGAGAGGAGAGGSGEAEGARMGGSKGASLATHAGVNLGQMGRALGQGIKSEVYGRMTGTGIRGGTFGGRVAHYIARNRPDSSPTPTDNSPPEENRIS